jgi:hypothetical protein
MNLLFRCFSYLHITHLIFYIIFSLRIYTTDGTATVNSPFINYFHLFFKYSLYFVVFEVVNKKSGLRCSQMYVYLSEDGTVTIIAANKHTTRVMLKVLLRNVI